MKVTLISVGTLSQKAYADAFSEYAKRFSAHGILECAEIREKKIDASPSEAQIAAALDFEGDAILSKIPPRAFVFAMAIEGKSMTSEAFASLLDRKMTEGVPEFCFVIGSSFGLSDKVKRRADALLSMSLISLRELCLRNSCTARRRYSRAENTTNSGSAAVRSMQLCR